MWWDLQKLIYGGIFSLVGSLLDIGYAIFLLTNPIGWVIALFTYFGDIVDYLSSVFSNIGSVIYENFIKAFETVGSVINAVVSVIERLFDAIVNGVRSAIAVMDKLLVPFTAVGKAGRSVWKSLFGSGFLHIVEGSAAASLSMFGMVPTFNAVGSAANATANSIATITNSAASAAVGIGDLARATGELNGATIRGVSLMQHTVEAVADETSPIAREAAASLRGAVVSPAALHGIGAPVASGGGGGRERMEITVPVTLTLDGEMLATAVAKVNEEDMIRSHSRPHSAMRGVPL